MKKSVNITSGKLFDETVYRYVKEAGFDGCDIDFTKKDVMSDENWERNAYRITELLEANSLSCVQVHLPVYDPFVSSEIILEDTKEEIINSLKAMKILGAEWGAYHAKTSFKDKFSIKTAFEDNKREISIYLEEAEKQGVGIAIENIPVHPDCPQYRFYTSDYEDLDELVRSFKSDKIGICWDFGHANLMPFRQEKAFKLLGDKIKITHIANNYRFLDDHNIPTFGYLDWKSVMHGFFESGYRGEFSLEVHYPYEDNCFKTFFMHGYESLVMLEDYFK